MENGLTEGKDSVVKSDTEDSDINIDVYTVSYKPLSNETSKLEIEGNEVKDFNRSDNSQALL